MGEGPYSGEKNMKNAQMLPAMGASSPKIVFSNGSPKTIYQNHDCQILINQINQKHESPVLHDFVNLCWLNFRVESTCDCDESGGGGGDFGDAKLTDVR